ncbi:PDZ/DHR/GLGF domain protein, partial [mine drainage metagenome]
MPLSFEQHRPYAKLTLIGPTGHAVRALFWLDTGGGAVILSGPLAARLGLKPMGKTFKAEGNVIVATQLPKISVGGLALQLKDANAFLVVGKKSTLEG